MSSMVLSSWYLFPQVDSTNRTSVLVERHVRLEQRVRRPVQVAAVHEPPAPSSVSSAREEPTTCRAR
ncbi:hypothetical protein [Nonomuraea dietziae]|uniref:hypothetical protein n=1 Tax=Nonomuraea dietziae TaxID=65515 RepID=UPI003430E10B